MAAQIKKQVDFYFSDSNFRKDAFLRSAAEKDAEGFIPIDTLLTFNKLKAMTTDAAAVAAAMEGSDIVVVSDCKTKLRRKEPLPMDDNSKQRTLYVKGFPTEEDISIEDIEAKFSDFGKVLMVRIRRENNAEKKFKGSAFIEFSTEAEMQKAVDESNTATVNEEGVPSSKVTLSYKETPFVCVMPFAEWLKRKQDKKGGKKDKDTSSTGKRVREEDEDSADEAPEKNEEYTKGCILHVENIPADGNFTLYQIKDVFKEKGNVKYVEYNEGDVAAFIRVADVESSEAIKKAVDNGDIKLGEGKITATVLEGAAEEEYWSKIISASNQGNKRGGGGRGGGRGGRGGRGGNKKRRF